MAGPWAAHLCLPLSYALVTEVLAYAALGDRAAVEVGSKSISGAGAWGVRRSELGRPGFSVLLEGRCLLAVEDHPPVTLEQGDFIPLPSTPAFTPSGFEPVGPPVRDPRTIPHAASEAHHSEDGLPDVRILGRNFVFDSSDTACCEA
ncbi:hypothetical protein ACWDG1_22710 [Streptomyces sp. NPDC001177]